MFNWTRCDLVGLERDRVRLEGLIRVPRPMQKQARQILRCASAGKGLWVGQYRVSPRYYKRRKSAGLPCQHAVVHPLHVPRW